MKEQDVAVKWFNTVFYPQNKTGRAVLYEEKILPRLRESEIYFFTPWGPRYDYKKRGLAITEDHKEVKVMKFLAGLLGQLKENMPSKKLSWFFLGADLYGTRINGLPKEVVSKYFDSLDTWLKKILPEVKLQLWSSFDQEAENYRKKVRQDFSNYIDAKLLARASKTAKGMRQGGDPNEYLVERIAEVMLIEKNLHPIKLSCVARYKDDKVDMTLPRLYFVPEALHAPWM